MPKSHRKNKKGGFLGMDTGSWTSGWGSSTSSSWNPFAKKEQTTSYVAPPQPQPQPQPQPLPQPQQQEPSMPQPMGGKRRRTKRSKRGGNYSPNISQTNLASSASPISGIQTAKALTWVGGKTRRRNSRRNKSRKHRRH
jgi:hypothetical protein